MGVPRMRAGVRTEIPGTSRTAIGEQGMSTAVARTREDLMELAATAGRELEGKPAEEIIAWAAETFGDRFCVTSSFADAVLAHLVSRVIPGVDVVFLDTGLHFAET